MFDQVFLCRHQLSDEKVSCIQFSSSILLPISGSTSRIQPTILKAVHRGQHYLFCISYWKVQIVVYSVSIRWKVIVILAMSVSACIEGEKEKAVRILREALVIIF